LRSCSSSHITRYSLRAIMPRTTAFEGATGLGEP
jgi:hypothetical protein